jgi:hypothetical protein
LLPTATWASGVACVVLRAFASFPLDLLKERDQFVIGHHRTSIHDSIHGYAVRHDGATALRRRVGKNCAGRHRPVRFIVRGSSSHSVMLDPSAMNLLALLIVLVVLALLIYGVQRYLPGDRAIKGVICLVLVAVACVALLSFAGVLPALRLR